MKTRVHILVTCRKAELLPASTLVFKTLRTGFPDAHTCVWANGPLTALLTANSNFKIDKDVDFGVIAMERSHGEWLADLVRANDKPFWICDTDVVFLDEVQSWFHERDGVAYAGRFEPEFWCEWTSAIHVCRLHPSLMYINPARLRQEMRRWPGQHAFFNSVEYEWFKWHWSKLKGDLLRFYDTCAGLYHALPDAGTEFDPEQNTAFEHLHCGSYVDLIAPHMGGERQIEGHRAVWSDPGKAKGMYEMQKQWYEEHAMNAERGVRSAE